MTEAVVLSASLSGPSKASCTAMRQRCCAAEWAEPPRRTSSITTATASSGEKTSHTPSEARIRQRSCAVGTAGHARDVDHT